jgi:hypothetical protein
MLSTPSLKSQIGTDAYSHLEKEADAEVAIALKMPLIDPSTGDKKYYHQRSTYEMFLNEKELFERLGIKFSPYDIFNILFRCKLFAVIADEDEYRQRIGAVSYVDEIGFAVEWRLKGQPFEEIVNAYLARMESFLKERTLFTEINSFDGSEQSDIPKFFNELFLQIGAPFCCFMDDGQLISKYREYEARFNESEYTEENARRYFHSPSIGFRTFGSTAYIHYYGSAWLRMLLNLMRIGSFVYPGQIDFGREGVTLIAPLGPGLIEDHSQGAYCWDEDSKLPWLKVPDGCLFLSFGYRGLSKMWLDTRTFESLKLFFKRSEVLFDLLRNPWTSQFRNDVSPSIDLLSTVTQIPDLGAKILLIYCCLEHLFVPKEVRSDNKKYIIGGINALKPELLPWFEDLYKLRCDYAHKGYVLKDEKLRGMVTKSVGNAFSLVIAKLVANPVV